MLVDKLGLRWIHENSVKPDTTMLFEEIISKYTVREKLQNSDSGKTLIEAIVLLEVYKHY